MPLFRPSADRGRVNLGWLDSRHTFSFGSYRDPEHLATGHAGFGQLRVINDDVVLGGGGFEPHSHSNMEIISYVLKGSLAHHDSLSNGSHLQAGDVQRMSAGTGIEHSEFNASPTDPVHFLQIWIKPARTGVAPSYAQKNFLAALDTRKPVLLVSPHGDAGSLKLHQEAWMWGLKGIAGQTLDLEVKAERGIWLHLIEGKLLMD
jgi:redox-sensitive bicupin YhaK (pirin superfamily)